MMSDVLPCLSKNNGCDITLNYMEVFCYRPSFFTIFSSSPDFKNIGVRELRFTALLAFTRCSMQYLIGSVLFFGSPCEIEDVVISGISIDVPAFHPRWASPHKRCEHQSVHFYSLFDTVMMKRDLEVTALVFS